MGIMLSRSKITWDSLQNKPTILADNQIDWSEIENKPSTFSPSSHLHNPDNSNQTHVWSESLGINHGAQIKALLSGTASNVGRYEKGCENGHYTIFIDGNDVNDSFFVVSKSVVTPGAAPDKLLLRIFRDGVTLIPNRLIIKNLPITSTGLEVGSLWRDANGFVKVVI